MSGAGPATHKCACTVDAGVMAPTARDHVWSAALEIVLNSSRWQFRTSHVFVRLDDRLEDPPSHKTIQRTLRAMTELGVLGHRSGSPRYTRGPLLREE